MSSTSTRANPNRGTVKSSPPNQTCRKNVRKNSGKQKISKYFTKSENPESGSQHKNCATKMKPFNLETSSSDLEAFKTPKAINKVSKISSKPPVKATRRRNTKQIPLTKFMEDNLQQTEVNPEHLQLALALSESSYEAENANESINSQSKRESFKIAFEKFGFGYRKLAVTNKKTGNPPKNKKSRYRFITPILKMRTSEEREDLIQSKISLILAQNAQKPLPKHNQTPLTLFNQDIEKISSRKLWNLNNLELHELNSSDCFYVLGLGIERSTVPCGSLLKDWGTIPGCEEDKINQISDCDSNEILNQNQSGRINGEGGPSAGIDTAPDPRIKDTDFVLELSFSPKVFKEDTSEENALDNVLDLNSFDSKEELESPALGGQYSSSPSTPSKCRSSPNKPENEDLKKQNNSDRKRSRSCLSPDLFGSDDEPSAKLTPVVDRLRGGQASGEIECFDLTQSDSNDDSYQAEIPQLQENSDLNVTDYVLNLLTQNVDAGNSPRKLEKISTSEDDSQSSQHSCYISDDELNYSSVFGASASKNKTNLSYDEKSNKENSPNKYNLSDDDSDLDGACGGKIQKIKSPRGSPIRQNLSKRFSGDCSIVDLVDKSVEANLCDSIKENCSESYSFPDGEFSFAEEKTKTSLFIGGNISDKKFPLKFSDELKPKSPEIYNFSDDDFGVEKLSLAERIKQKNKTLDVTPHKQGTSGVLDNSQNKSLKIISTPETPSVSAQNPFIVKTKNVTPMANYDEMDTPKIQRELDKFGLKPLRRQKGAKLLKYIYESTHPIIDENLPKRAKLGLEATAANLDDEVGGVILERKQSKRVASCPVPLHIVWYNFVMSNPKIRENILLYEPLQLEVLHSMLREQGFKFNIQDLLEFLDKKCVTIRTNQGQHHKEIKHR